MKNSTLYGLLIGFMLAVGALWQGLLGFLVVLVFVTIGGAIGAHFEGRIDLRDTFKMNGGNVGRG